MEKLKVWYFEEDVKQHDTTVRSYNDKCRFIVIFENSSSASDVKWLEGYDVVGEHFNVESLDYFENNCKEITKDEYVNATKGWYTPKEYL